MANETVEAPQAEEIESTDTEKVEAPVTESQAAPEVPTEFDPNKIDPKAKEYFEKTYAEKYKDYDDVKNAANQFRQVQSDPRWQKFVESVNTPAPAPKFEISPEDHAAALGDPAKFQEIIMRAAEHVSQTKYAPKIEQFEKEAQFNKASSELAQVVAKNPEFKELDQAGHILPVLQRYPGISFSDALAIAKQNSGWEAKKAASKAAGEVQTQKKAITERPGNPSNTGKAPKHFKTSSEALEWIGDEIAAGREVDPDDWTSDN